ncbi:MAG: hypothetical protein KME19_00520 [Microcoleus vaginatus WJT46-NPBG5]|jgi:hypothetical protein|nr:hypothetical protein [Microcoleus vaginatus WJT46-NPBG5]
MKSTNPPASAKSRNWLVLAGFAAMGVIPFALPQSSFAQACAGAQALRGCGAATQSNEVSTFSGRNDGQLNMLDLIHQAQMGSLGNMEEFTAEQRENVNSAAETYRNQQLQRIQGQPEAKPPVEEN